MNKYINPPLLRKGDKAVIISPSGSIDPIFVDGAISVLQEWGLNVSVSRYAKAKLGRFCGTVEERLSDLQTAMDDDDVKLIFCSRGGYGIVHLLDKLDFTKIKKSPKWLVGYSDITALHLAFLKEGITSLHAPMARHLTEEENDLSTEYLRKALFEGKLEYTATSHTLNRLGNVDGYLVGGNLAVFSGLMGTPYSQIPENSILFIEDIGESPYKIDRMMWQLKLSGMLSKLSGLIVGQFTDCEEDPLMYDSIYQGILNMVDGYNYPVVFDFPVGHVQENYPLLHGANVSLTVQPEEVLLQVK